MSFLFFSNTKFQFTARKLTWMSYTVNEALHIAKQVKPIDKHKFTKVGLDENSGIFVIHVIALKTLDYTIYLLHALLLATLQQNKALTKYLFKYTDFTNVFP